MGEYPTGPSVSAPDIPRIMRRTGPWVRFIGVLVLIGAGLMVCGGICFLVVSLKQSPLGIAVGVLAYLIAAGVNIFFGICLLRYATRIDRYTAIPGEERLAEALEAQRVYWKAIGVVAIIWMVLMVLVLLGVMVVALVRA